jgi:murein DD-endopeptidase MepM/ murein hydrolase activator NlpD
MCFSVQGPPARADCGGMPSFRSAARAGVLAALVLGALSVLPASASASSANTAALQVALKALHHYDAAIDGISGPKTRHGLRVFQKAHHLTVDGIVGPQTLHALGWRGREQLGKRLVRRHQKGWDVAAVQFLLGERGYSPGTPDGGFGQLTDTATHRFQRHCHMSADGMVGSHTLHALIHGCSGGGSSGGGGPSGPVRFFRPVNAPITSPFGMRGGRMHTGVDFGAPYGTPIGAGGVGTVSSAGWNSGGYGYLVIIQHRLGFSSWYAHMSRVTAYVGEHVSGGTTIGYVGATGHATGPHLHFEVRIDGVPVDPMPYLLSTTGKLNPSSVHREPPDGCAPDAEADTYPKTARLGACK